MAFSSGPQLPTPQQWPTYWSAPEPFLPPAKTPAKFSSFTIATVAFVCILMTAVITFALVPTREITVAPTPAPAPAVTDAGLQDLASADLNEVLASVFTVAVRSSGAQGSGSGVAIDNSHIITNSHVVNLEGATSPATVEVQNAVGDTFEATVVGSDAIADVAVLKVKNASLTPLKWSSAAPTVGQGVIALGAPLGLSNTVTAGIVSTLDRPVVLTASQNSEEDASDNSTYINAIQTDAAINSGNSGGPLITADGALIGLNVAIASTSDSAGSIGIGYAIPAAYVRRVASEIIAKGEASHGRLGVQVATVSSPGGSFQAGASVQSIDNNSSASASALRKEDVIVAWNGKQVPSSDSLIGFTKSTAPGTRVTLTVVRNDNEIGVPLTVGSDKA